MKILLVSRFFPYIGGREVLVMLLAQKLCKEHQVVIATPDVGRVSKDFEIISNDPKSLKNCFDNFKPDVINSHTFYLTPQLIRLSKKYKVPLVLTIHGDIFGFGSDSDKALLRSMIPQLDSIVAVCEHGKGQMLKNEVDPRRILRIYPGIDTNMFDGIRGNRDFFRKSFQLPENKYIFITPARMTKYKGIEVLLKAVSHLDVNLRSNMLFWVTTPSTRYREDELEYTKEIYKLAESLGVKDNFVISFSDYTSMPFAYMAANAFILPSLTEQFPVTILEAMASELPIISTEVGGVSEAISDKTGCLIRPDDAIELSESIVEVYKTTNKTKVDLAKEQVRSRFNIDRMVGEYLNLYKNLCS